MRGSSSHWRVTESPRHLILVPVLAVSNRQRHVEFVGGGKIDMRPFIYRCPNTGYVVQAHADDVTANDNEAPQTVSCMACGGTHLVDPATGELLVPRPEAIVAQSEGAHSSLFPLTEVRFGCR